MQFSWRRNLYVIWFGEVISIAAFNAVIPFLPYYVQSLGVTSPGQVELWSGLLLSGQAVSMAIFSPIWGTVADVRGRKLMLERALFGGAIIMALMGRVTNVQQLLLLRIIQGAVTGSVAAANTLVAAGTPITDTAFAMGLLQMGVYAGSSLGPMIGGFVADAWGYRASFYLTSILLLVSGILTVAMVHDVKSDGKNGGRSFAEGIRLVVRLPAVQAAFAVQLAVRSAWRTAVPILPLYVQSLLPGSQHVASLVGLMQGVNMAAISAASVAMGRAADRLGVRKILFVAIAGCALFYGLHSITRSVGQLFVLQLLAGLAMGGFVATISANLARSAPDGCQGIVFGLDSSVMSAANAIGPMLGSTVAATWGLSMPFVASAGVFGLAIGVLMLQGTMRPAAVPAVQCSDEPTSATASGENG